jgi:tetratricopeptide (TPR) repeat protein
MIWIYQLFFAKIIFKIIIKLHKEIFVNIFDFGRRFISNKKIIAVTFSIISVLIILLIFYKPVLSNVYWKMALSVRDKNFNKAVVYIDKAYNLTHEEFLINVKIDLYVDEAKKVMISDHDKALELLDTCYKIKQNDKAKDLIFTICTDLANSFFDTDIEKCIYYINKALSYGSNDELIKLSQKAYAKLTELRGSGYANDSLNRIQDNPVKDELKKAIDEKNTALQEFPKEPDKVAVLYINAVAAGSDSDMSKYEYAGDRFDLYFHERDLTPKKFIPKGVPLNIVKMEDISASYNAPDNEKFFSVVYKNNNVDTLIYVLMVNDSGTWKVYGIV